MAGTLRGRETDRKSDGGREIYTVKWRVLFLYPLAWISISISSSSPPLPSLPLCPFLHLLKSPFGGQKQQQQHVSDMKLTGSPLAVHLPDTCWCFWETPFPSGSGEFGLRALFFFFFPSHTVQTHRLAFAKTASLIGMLTYSQTAKPQLAPCGRELDLTWNQTAKKKKERSGSLKLHSNTVSGFSNNSNFIYRPCSFQPSVAQTEDDKTQRQPIISP